jgi:hypothetical protein
MRLLVRASAVAAVLGSATLAPSTATAAPVLSGAYILSASSNCQAMLTTVTNAEGQVIAVTVNPAGNLNGIAGTVTFTPETGRALVSAISVDGSLLLKQGSNTETLKQTAVNEDWAYSNTDFALTLNGIVYRAVYGKRANGIVQQFNVVGREEGNRCVFTGAFSRR